MRCPTLLCFVLLAGLSACSPAPGGAGSPAAAVPVATAPLLIDTGRRALAGPPPPPVERAVPGRSAVDPLRVEADAGPAPGPRPPGLALVTRPAAGEADVPVAQASGLGPAVSVQLVDPEAAGAAPGHLLLWEFELRGPDGELVPSQVLAGGAAQSGRVALINDPGLAEGSLLLVPLVPLEPGVTYTAYFTARRAGAGDPITRAWPFTTADG
jgi:hypothetical protein